MSENLNLCCGICRVCCYSTYQCCCCVDEPPSPPVFQVVCLGVTNSGKTTLLTVLTSENPDTVVPTVGFNIKDVRLPNSLLKVKELGGGDNIRPFWSRYYTNVEGVIFVIDGLCTHEQLEDTRREIHEALKHPALKSLPWLILCNKQDLEGACTHQRVIEELQLRKPMQDNTNIIIKSCSKTNKAGLISNFETFSELLLRYYSERGHHVGAVRV